MKTLNPVTVVTEPETTKRPVRVLRPAAVAARVGLSIPTIWRLRRAGQFPKSIRLSKGAIGFYERDIDNWLAERAAQFTASE